MNKGGQNLLLKLLISFTITLLVFKQIHWHGLEEALVYQYQTSNAKALRDLKIYQSFTIGILISLSYFSISVFQKMLCLVSKRSSAKFDKL